DLEDFIIKQRPKQIGVISVPKDAKEKLKTSAYGHVSNPPQIKEIKPVSPTEVPKQKLADNLLKPKIPEAPLSPKKQVTLENPVIPKPIPPKIPQKTNLETQESSKVFTSEISDSKEQKKKKLEEQLMDLKIKKSKFQKMALDFEMQELTGEITPEELNEKMKKLEIIEKKTDEQIQQTQKYLDELDSLDK
ncbi:MAG: hypothetical protein ACFFAN_17655, partial [Promethearchaeota archaeon]